MLTTSGKNQLLDATDITHLGAHSAYPGDAGSNELSGGSPAYARKAASWAAAASGSKATSNAQAFDIPAGTTVGWLAGWTALTVGACRAVAPLGGSPKRFQVDVTNNKILCEGHGYADGDRIVFYNGTAPTGLTAGTEYFVRAQASADPDSFEVAATSGGAAIDITGQPGAGCVVSKIVPETFASQGTLNVAAGAFAQNLNG
jgi:hypothetical protein